MATTANLPTTARTEVDIIDFLIDCGFLPPASGHAEEPAWLENYGRHQAWIPLPGGMTGLIVITDEEGCVTFTVTNPNGIVHAEFPCQLFTELQRAMFVGLVAGAREEL